MAQSTPVSKKTTAKKPSQANKATTKTLTTKSKKSYAISDDERYQMINETAYLNAEKRGFHGENAMDDWLQAEAEVDAKFSSSH